MTEQPTDQQVIEHLAKVMGWHKESEPDDFGQAMWLAGDRRQGAPLDEWNPLTEDRDAMQVVDAMLEKGWGFQLHSPGINEVWTAVIITKESKVFFGHNPSRARAISMAAYAATKEER